MLSDVQLYTARRQGALELSVILVELGVGNDVQWPAALSAEIVAEEIDDNSAPNDTPTVFTAVTGELSLNKRDVMLCRGDGYDIAPGMSA